MGRIYEMNSFSARVRFKTQQGWNQAELAIHKHFDKHKVWIARAEGDRFPGENRPKMKEMKEELLSYYNSTVGEIDKSLTVNFETWNEFIFLTYIKAGGLWHPHQ